MTAELQRLHALARQRRNAGEPCNPMREGIADVDYLSEAHIQELHKLGLQIELARLIA